VPSGMARPRVAMFSFSVTGTPSSGPTAVPASHRASDARAMASASSALKSQVACRNGSQRSTCATTAVATSTGDKLPVA